MVGRERTPDGINHSANVFDIKKLGRSRPEEKTGEVVKLHTAYHLPSANARGSVVLGSVVVCRVYSDLG